MINKEIFINLLHHMKLLRRSSLNYILNLESEKENIYNCRPE